MIFPGQKIYPDNEDDEDHEYYEICSKQIDASIKNFIFKMVMIFSSMVTALIWPSYKFVSQGIKTTATQVKFPFLDESSNYEFVGNFLLQSVIMGHGFIGYFAMKVAMDICTDFISASQKLLQYRLKMLDIQREKEPLKSLQPLFSNTIQQIRTYDKYDLVR